MRTEIYSTLRFEVHKRFTAEGAHLSFLQCTPQIDQVHNEVCNIHKDFAD